MGDGLDGIWRPIYRELQIYWLVTLAGTVLSCLGDHIVLAVISIALSAVKAYQVYALRAVSDGMDRAWRVLLISLVLTFGGLLLAVLAAGSVLGALLLVVSFAGVIVLLVADYFFFTGLDELVGLRGYAYPAGRIRWCFWLSLIGAVVAGAADGVLGIGSVVGLAIQAAILYLLWQYLQAVKQSEQGA
ncbi:MAG: hypothetical protein Q4D31_01010 [Eubacteriales bacterium]|nr:hypothetical protein [Eubacteriales bacterium]